MMMLPKINRRGWLATWLQHRRRARVRGALPTLLPAPVLAAAYPDLAVWSWDYPNPAYWYAYHQHADGEPFTYDDRGAGTDRQYAPDGGQYLMFIVGVDADGREITARSNAVRPDDVATPPVPVVTTFEVIDNNGMIDVNIAWTWNGQGWPESGSFFVEVYKEGAQEMELVNNGLVDGSQRDMSMSELCTAEDILYYCRVMYKKGSSMSAWSAMVTGSPY